MADSKERQCRSCGRPGVAGPWCSSCFGRGLTSVGKWTVRGGAAVVFVVASVAGVRHVADQAKRVAGGGA